MTDQPHRWLVRMFPHQLIVQGDTFEEAEADLDEWCQRVGIARGDVQEFRLLDAKQATA